MAKKAIFYPTADAEVLSFYDNVVKRLVLLAAKYGIPAALITLLTNHSTQLVQAKMKSDADQQAAKQSVKLKDQAFASSKIDLMRELKRITDLPNFDEADAMGLGIRKESTPESLVNVQPTISNVSVTPDVVIFDWLKGRMDALVGFGSDDGIVFEDLGTDIRSPFEDRRKNKVPGKAEIRHYKFRYKLGDEMVGQFSDVISIMVLID